MNFKLRFLLLIVLLLPAFLQAQTDAVSGASLSADVRERLKAELKAELLEELRGEWAEAQASETSAGKEVRKTEKAARDTSRKKKTETVNGPRLQVGGYGEAVI